MIDTNPVLDMVVTETGEDFAHVFLWCNFFAFEKPRHVFSYARMTAGVRSLGRRTGTLEGVS